MADSRVYRTWRDRIESGVFTKSQCNTWCHQIYAQQQGHQPGGHRTNLTREEAVRLVQQMREAGGVLLTREHEEQGLAWLRKNARKGMDLPQDVLDTFHHFSFQGKGHDVSQGPYRSHFVPVWRIHTTDGRLIDYYNSAWQNTGKTLRGWREVLRA